MLVSSVDVQPFAVEHAEQPQPGLVAEQTVERGGLTHIYKSTRIDAVCQIRAPPRPACPAVDSMPLL